MMVISGSGECAIDGMESIVAAVSGFHGTERFKLIKLISLAGGNYVGTMSRSTTHLFCWKFEGKKYDLAQKHGTIILNHRWLEDCIKTRKRVPEYLYTLHSGCEVGSIAFELPAISRVTLAHTESQLPFLKSNGCTSVINVESEEIEGGIQHDDWLLDEELLQNLFPKPSHSKNAPCQSRSKKKVDGNFPKRDRRENSNSKISQPRRVPSQKPQHEESSSDASKLVVELSRTDSHDTRCTESSRRRRRLVKKNVERNLISSDDSGAEEEYNSSGTEPEPVNNATGSSNSNHLNNCNSQIEANFRSISERESVGHRFIGIEEVAEVKVTYGRKGINGLPNSCLSPFSRDRNIPEPEMSSRVEKSSEKLEIGQVADCCARVSPPVEVSCAICWTDYSSTRGVLQCGHRFCFSCIQRWADRSTSIGKQTKCPMCAASFSSIIKVDEAGCLDQKVYSQTVPCDSSTEDIFIVPDAEPRRFVSQISSESVCYRCQSRVPEDLLMPCRFCQIQCVHSYCLDPPLFPWICNGCKGLQMFRRHRI
ncbi:hypothetical protein Dimus_016992 [Dionaea muscipula]